MGEYIKIDCWCHNVVVEMLGCNKCCHFCKEYDTCLDACKTEGFSVDGKIIKIH